MLFAARRGPFTRCRRSGDTQASTSPFPLGDAQRLAARADRLLDSTCVHAAARPRQPPGAIARFPRRATPSADRGMSNRGAGFADAAIPGRGSRLDPEKPRSASFRSAPRLGPDGQGRHECSLLEGRARRTGLAATVPDCTGPGEKAGSLAGLSALRAAASAFRNATRAEQSRYDRLELERV